MSKQLAIRIVIIGAVSVLLGTYLVKYLLRSNATPRFEDVLVSVADETNKKLPMMIDSDTRLDSTIAGGGKSFIYLYTLVNFVKRDIDTASLRLSLQHVLLQNYKTSPPMEQFRAENVELHYRYQDKNGEYLLEIVVSPSMF